MVTVYNRSIEITIQRVTRTVTLLVVVAQFKENKLINIFRVVPGTNTLLFANQKLSL